MDRNNSKRYPSTVGDWAFMAIVVLLLGLFWYMFGIGVIVTYDKFNCQRQHIGETCILVAVPE
tara:strand:+ start:2503 stop:2691 length:189 start_codon:yes stop_codon:yes gene_type:complete